MSEFNTRNAYAILIGVGEDLTETLDDANSMFKLLTNRAKGAYAIENVISLTEKTATKDNVIQNLDKLIEKTKKNKDSTVIIYYSGHGVKKVIDGKPNYFLKTYNSDFDEAEKTMIEGNEFASRLNQIKASKLLVMLDCCHANGLKKKGLKRKGSSKPKNDMSIRYMLKNLEKGKGRVFLSSCDDAEESVILPGSRNSLFTEVVLEALNGVGGDGGEFIPVIDLIYHVIKEVPKRVKEYSHPQNPVLHAENVHPEYYICKNAAHSSMFAIDTVPIEHTKVNSGINSPLANPLIIDTDTNENIQILDADLFRDRASQICAENFEEHDLQRILMKIKKTEIKQIQEKLNENPLEGIKISGSAIFLNLIDAVEKRKQDERLAFIEAYRNKA